MLRRQQYSVDLGEVQYVAPPKKSCVSRKQRIEEAKKEACGVGVLKPYDVDENGTTLSKIKGNMLDNITKLNNHFKDHVFLLRHAWQKHQRSTMGQML